MILPQRFYGPAQPTGSNTTLFTVPATITTGRAAVQQCIIKQIWVANTSLTSATLTLDLLAVGASVSGTTKLLNAIAFSGSTSTPLAVTWVLAPGEIIAGLQNPTGALTVMINGYYHV